LSIQKPILYASVATYGFKNVVTRNCRLQCTATSSIQLFNFYKSTVLDVYKEFVFDNNVVFNASTVAVQIANTDQSVSQSGTTWEMKASLSNNIFYNCPSSNGYFKFFKVGSLTMEKNVFRADASSDITSYCFFFYGSGQTGTGITATDNLAYGLTKSWLYAVSTSTYVPDSNVISKLDSDPFTSFDTTTGSYVLNAVYTAFGPQ
jgi:hypothetical protein